MQTNSINYILLSEGNRFYFYRKKHALVVEVKGNRVRFIEVLGPVTDASYIIMRYGAKRLMPTEEHRLILNQVITNNFDKSTDIANWLNL